MKAKLAQVCEAGMGNRSSRALLSDTVRNGSMSLVIYTNSSYYSIRKFIIADDQKYQK